jgi:ceramide glucosyltransferase
MTVLSIVGWLPVALALAAIGYTVQATRAVRAFARAPRAAPAAPEPVSLLKPLHGAEPRLRDNLSSFLDQHWAAPIQMVAGSNRADDPALDIARQLRGEVVLRGGAPVLGANAKIANLVGLAPAAEHDLLVLSDSDMAVPRDYLARVAATLAQPGVGVVTCLYHGRGDAGGWSRFAAAAIDWQFLPGVATALALGTDHPCMGSTIALRRATLDAIGGFAAFSDILADDHAIGAAVRGLGQGIAVVPGLTIAHGCTEQSFSALWRHELRWAVTVRGVVGARYAGVLLTHPLPLALLASLVHPTAGLAAAAAALIARVALARTVAGVAGHRPAPLAWLPARDLLSFAVYVASFIVAHVDWRGASLRMESNGRITAAPEPTLP